MWSSILRYVNGGELFFHLSRERQFSEVNYPQMDLTQLDDLCIVIWIYVCTYLINTIYHILYNISKSR